MYSELESDSVARLYAHRPGCRFVGHHDVAIAIFVMELRVVLLEPRPVPPIDEFVLRAINLQIQSPPGIAELLGLDPRTVKDRLVEMRRAELIDVVSAGTSSTEVVCSLTPKGQAVANSLKQNEYIEQTITVAFHGFLRRPLLIDQDALLTPKEATDQGLALIRAIPSRYPRPDEIDLAKLAKVISNRSLQRGDRSVPELISVKSVARGVRTMYQPAVMLQYEMGQKLMKRQLFAFAVNGRVDDDLEQAFVECDGPKAHPELILDNFRSAGEIVRQYVPPHIADQLGDLEGVDEIADRLDSVSERIASTTSRIELEDRPDTKVRLREENESLKREKAELQAQLKAFPGRQLKVFDCARILDETLDTVEERLVIISAFVGLGGVTPDFLRRLEAALKRGVKVWIGYGMPKSKHHDKSNPGAETAETKLRDLRKLFRKHFILRTPFDTHEKILLCDDKFVVTGSYNWLSFRPDGKNKRREDALQITHREMVEQYFEEQLANFEAS